MIYLKIYLNNGEPKICIDITDIASADIAITDATAIVNRAASSGAPAGMAGDLAADLAAAVSADASAAPTAWAATR